MSQYKLSWKNVESLTNKIYKKINKFKKEETCILGVSKGGLVPSVLLSHKLQECDMLAIGIKSYIKSKQAGIITYQSPELKTIKKYDNVIVVDDICDTGNTFKFVKDLYCSYTNIYTVSLIYRENTDYEPNFFGEKLTDKRWVVFPWE